MSSKHHTSSFLSRLAFLRADVTALASFSAIQALNIFTAKEADIPTKQRAGEKKHRLRNQFLKYSHEFATYANQFQILFKRKKTKQKHKPSLTRLSLKRLVRIGGGSVPLANRMPVSMASLVCSDSVNAFRKRRSYAGIRNMD